MAARFEVERVFPLEDRALFVVEGVIREGMVKAGMVASLEGAEETFTRRVHGVEFLSDPSGPSEPGGPCLTFHCRDADRLEAWLALEWEGGILDLGWESPQ